jgi:hypothetical protein
MNSGVKAAIGGTVVMLLVVGGELLYLHHERNAPVVVPGAATAPAEKADLDDFVYLKKQRPSSMEDLKDLYGKTVWVSAGGQMDYYTYAGAKAAYTKSVGTLLGAEPMVIKGAFEQVAPKSATFRIPGGDKQVLLAFTMPKSADPAKEYAVPVGYQEGKDFTFYTDELFFYDDPHELYKHWGTAVWQAVDSHQVVTGMNERQVQLSLGQVSKSLSNDYGNRMVVYANMGKPIAVTFVKNAVTTFRDDQGF